MARIAGVNIDDKLKIDYALTQIKGIGWSLSKKILKELDFDLTKRVADLTSGEVGKIASKIEGYAIEGELARKVRNDINRHRQISSYRGIRHTRGLPVRGQRTKTNARTKRGKRRTVGAFKKQALVKMQPGGAKKEDT